MNVDLAENSHRGLSVLPDGRHFLFTSRSSAPENGALYFGSLETGEVRRLMSAQSKAAYLPARGGHPAALLYYRDGGLEARAFDAESGTLVGEPYPFISGVDYAAAGIAAFFQTSTDGRVIVFAQSGSNDRRLTWFERSGEQTGTLGEPGVYLQPRISPKADRVAFTQPDPQLGNRDVWTIDIARAIVTPLTKNPANDWHGVWSPDGEQMAFSSDRRLGRQSEPHLKKSIDISAEESILRQQPGAPSDWSRDGKWIAYSGVDAGGNGIEVVAIADRTATLHIDGGPFRVGGARFSPDGRWLAYASNENGRFEVFVRPFDGATPTQDKVQLSDAGGDFPVWRADGQELYYMGGDFTVYSVSTADLRVNGPVPRPQKLFRACPASVTEGQPLRGTWWTHPYDTLDGKRFVVNCTSRPPGQFVILMNWAPFLEQ